ncbi:MAG: 3-hydroxyacyl-ACP dehydratase FabZ [Acidobacteria bacterium]|nr:3-hydroxyacyl-ACP dehydratase FabZ [Acidobacteriota bacterium]
MILDINEIQKILPHRPPFLLVDRIIELEPGKRIVGIKNVTINEPFFVGHFPSFPVMPGVLIVEAMAQTGGVLLLRDEKDYSQKLLLFAAIEEAKFRKPVVPGDQLRMELEILSRRATFCRIKGHAYVDGQLAAQAILMCKLAERPR